MSRQRTRGSVGDVTNSLKYYSQQVLREYSVGAGWHLAYQTVPITLYGFAKTDNRQTITDEVHGRRRFNSCLHTKHFDWSPLYRSLPGKQAAVPSNISVVPTDWIQYGIAGVEWTGPGAYSAHWGPISANYGFDFSLAGLPSVDWASMTNEVGLQLDGHMVTSQNLLVDLVQITQTVNSFKNPLGLFKLAQKLGRKTTLSKMSKFAASGYLEYKFGWENIYRDVAAIAAVWSEVRTHLKYLRATAGSYTPISSRRVDKITDPAVQLYEYGLGGSNLLRVYPKISSIKRTACFSLDVCRRSAEVAWSFMDQVFARLGSRDVLSALWDIVPYSFIVDWFTHMSREIAQQSISWNSFDLRNIGYSTKYEVFIGGRMKTSFMNPFTYEPVVMQDDELDPKMVQSLYQRVGGFPPNCFSVGLFGNLSKTQIAEGAALIIQRL